jgi:NADH-quinone oxidoreductase subunit N
MNLISDKIEWSMASLGFIYPEIIIALGLLLLIVVGLVFRNGHVARLCSLFILIVGFIVLLLDGPVVEQISLFGGMLKSTAFTFYLRALLISAGILIVLLSEPKTIKKNPYEYFALMLSILLGALLLVMSEHFAMVILSLELMSIPAYVLAGFAFDKRSAEASLKYFIYGSVATAFMIFGFSWLYGLSETMIFTSTAFAEKLKFNGNEIFFATGLMALAGLLFKMAATPFHFWAPDVYQSTPMPVLALFSSVPKIAAGAVLIKFTIALGLGGGARYDWQSILAVLAIATLTIGNFSALWQINAKRLMAYSSIGQAGFLLVAVATLTTNSNAFFFFYSAVLLISTVLVFSVLEFFEREYHTVNLSDFQGLGKVNPVMAVLLLIGLLSLVGLPITAGFTAKLFLFSGLLEAWSSTGKEVLIWLFGFGLLNTVVSLYYYLRIPYFMFLKEPKSDQVAVKQVFPVLLGVVLAMAILVLFFWPDWLMNNGF